jgi:hypothetical protein
MSSLLYLLKESKQCNILFVDCYISNELGLRNIIASISHFSVLSVHLLIKRSAISCNDSHFPSAV